MVLKGTGHEPVSERPADASTPEGRVRPGGCERTRLWAGGRVPVRFERTGGWIEGAMRQTTVTPLPSSTRPITAASV